MGTLRTRPAEGSSNDRASLRLSLDRALWAGENLQVPLGFSRGAVGTDFTLSLSESPTVAGVHQQPSEAPGKPPPRAPQEEDAGWLLWGDGMETGSASW